jgi:hypothetical protein
MALPLPPLWPSLPRAEKLSDECCSGLGIGFQRALDELWACWSVGDEGTSCGRVVSRGVRGLQLAVECEGDAGDCGEESVCECKSE